MNILYFGNRSGKEGKYPTVQDELTPLFGEMYSIISVSDKKGSVKKAIDMFFTFWRHIWKTDVVLIDTFSTTNFYFALAIGSFCRMLNKPFINFLHGGDLPLRLKNNPFLSKLTFKYSYKLVAPSNFMKVSFEKFGYNPVLIPNMLNIKKYSYKQANFAEVKLFWLRSFRKHYNPLLAVQVLNYLRQEGFQADLIMVGPDSHDGSLEEVNSFVKHHNLEDFVQIPGVLTKPEWMALSKDRNILINTTNIDNTPISVIECMALGLAIVSTKVGGIPYLLDHNQDAILVEPNNTEAMASAIKKLVAHPHDTEKQVLKAREKVAAFDWNVVKNKWVDLLNNAAGTQ